MTATFDATPEPRSANLSAIRAGRLAPARGGLLDEAGQLRPSAGVNIPISEIVRAVRFIGRLITRRRKETNKQEVPPTMAGLRKQQSEFARRLPRLIDYAIDLGFEVTIGEAYRPPETAQLYERQGRGVADSFHCRKLAIDLFLFRDGVYLTATEDYRPLGEFWESIGGSWGGRFPNVDGNHFSWGEER